MTQLVVKASLRRAHGYTIQFARGNGGIIEDLAASARTVGDAVDMISEMPWPPQAVIARVLDLGGGVLYEICRTNFR
jgi:hypothetical protein